MFLAVLTNDSITSMAKRLTVRVLATDTVATFTILVSFQ